MWEPRPLTPLWAFTACYRDSFYQSTVCISKMIPIICIQPQTVVTCLNCPQHALIVYGKPRCEDVCLSSPKCVSCRTLLASHFCLACQTDFLHEFPECAVPDKPQYFFYKIRIVSSLGSATFPLPCISKEHLGFKHHSLRFSSSKHVGHMDTHLMATVSLQNIARYTLTYSSRNFNQFLAHQPQWWEQMKRPKCWNFINPDLAYSPRKFQWIM
jgi:hypothetical protein